MEPCVEQQSLVSGKSPPRISTLTAVARAQQHAPAEAETKHRGTHRRARSHPVRGTRGRFHGRVAFELGFEGQRGSWEQFPALTLQLWHLAAT